MATPAPRAATQAMLKLKKQSLEVIYDFSKEILGIENHGKLGYFDVISSSLMKSLLMVEWQTDFQDCPHASLTFWPSLLVKLIARPAKPACTL